MYCQKLVVMRVWYGVARVRWAVRYAAWGLVHTLHVWCTSGRVYQLPTPVASCSGHGRACAWRRLIHKALLCLLTVPTAPADPT